VLSFNAGKVLSVKKVICHLLILWLVLVSGGSYAHATGEAAHETDYAHDHSAHKTQNQAAAVDSLTASDAAPADACNQSHCGHGHTTVVPTQHSAHGKTAAVSLTPQFVTSWATSHITSNIERPKWPVTTPAVVNHLS
jgi:hypothetical protein